MHSPKSMYAHGLIMYSPLELVSLRSIKLGLKILESKPIPGPNRNLTLFYSTTRAGSIRP